ncbi:unnamed protein product [Brassica oleracea]
MILHQKWQSVCLQVQTCHHRVHHKSKSLLRVTTFHFSEVPCLYIACLPQTLKLYHIERLLQGHLVNQWNGSLVPPDQFVSELQK